MQIRFDSKIVVVSCAGHGFRRCIAETFAGLGARVFGCDLLAVELARRDGESRAKHRSARPNRPRGGGRVERAAEPKTEIVSNLEESKRESVSYVTLG